MSYEPRSDTVSTGELMLFLGDSFVVTVRHGSTCRSPLRRHLEEQPEMLRHGPTGVLYSIADSIVDHYLDVATELQTDLEELEAEASHPPVAAPTTRPRGSTPSSGRSSIPAGHGPAGPALSRLAGQGTYGTTVPFVQEKSRPFFRDVSDHLARVNESVEALDRLVSDILSAHLAQASVRQNDDVRKISRGRRWPRSPR